MMTDTWSELCKVNRKWNRTQKRRRGWRSTEKTRRTDKESLVKHKSAAYKTATATLNALDWSESFARAPLP